MPASPELIISSELVASVAEMHVAAGDAVAVGASVMVLESMKMEIPVMAEQAGTVTEVAVAPGEVVQDGDVLVVLRRS